MSDAARDAGVSADSGLPCAIADLVARHCASCHGQTPLFGAPMSLTRYSDWAALSPDGSGQPVYADVEQRVHADVGQMPPPPNTPLSADELATLDAWIAGGAPSMDCKSAPATDGGMPPVTLSCTPDRHLVPTTPIELSPSMTDDYFCYGLDVPVSKKRHVIAFAPHLDNTAVLHHTSLFQSDTSVSPTPAECPPLGAQANWRPMWGWAPGVQPYEMPAEAGFPEEGTVHYVVQLHYHYTTTQVGQLDQSGFDLCTTEQLRPNDADVMAFGALSFSIPAHSSLDWSCTVQVPWYGDTTHLIASLPHMHKLGQLITTTSNGIDLGSQLHWDYSHQQWISVDHTLSPNDFVTTRCLWENSGDAAVDYGVTTDDEMCFSFLMYYPRITNAAWNPLLPAEGSLCGLTP